MKELPSSTPHACTTGLYASITFSTSIPTNIVKKTHTLLVLAKHRATP
jgi:hypothetical protein